MKKLLYIALLIVGYIYSQPGFPCYDIDIGNGLPNQNGELTGIQDCNLLCIGLDIYSIIASDSEYGCLCDPNQNENLGLIQCNQESGGIMVESTYVDFYCGEFNYQNLNCINPNNIISGDINGNEVVNIVDIVGLVYYILCNSASEYDENYNCINLTNRQLVNCDSNNDLYIDVFDFCGLTYELGCSYNSQATVDIRFEENIVIMENLTGHINGIEFIIKHPLDFDISPSNASYVFEYININDSLTIGLILFDQPSSELFQTSSNQFSVISMKPFDSNYLTTNLINFPDYYDLNNDNLSIENIIISKKYSLSSIYPNPFNPITNISYGLPLETDIALNVYDVEGRKISTLVQGLRQAGNHTIEWNAEGYPSGVYFVKLDAGEFTQTQKLMLVK